MNITEDAKFASARGRNRTFFVANPSSDSDGEDHFNRQQQYGTPSSPPSKSSYPPNQAHPSLLSPSSNLSYSTILSPPQHAPAPLTTNLPPDHAHQYPSSRSNPALSSPSSSGSPAAESTPPPSTPGMINPPADFYADNQPFREPNHVPNGERNDSLHLVPPRPLATGSQISSQNRVPQIKSNVPRANPSPTVSTPNSYASTTSQASTSTLSGKLLIVVTSDSERYLTVDISGAEGPAFIKERIFSKLCIWDEEEQRQYSIYRTEIGHFAIGEALTDDRLFDLCREQGDNIGSLKFFVSLSSAPVHEPYQMPIPQIPSIPSSAVNTIPPPVIPYNQGPLRPKRRSSSRHGSLSSTGERLPEPGYEASVSDDFDATQQRPSLVHRSARPSNQNINHSNFPSSPRGGRRPTGGPPRPRSPLSTTIKTASIPRPRGESPPNDKFMVNANLPPAPPPPTMPPPPAPLSPNRPVYDDNSIPSVIRTAPHARSGSDSVTIPAGTSAEQLSRAWRQKQQLEEKLSADRLREQQPAPLKPAQARRQPFQPNMLVDEDRLARTESWVVVDPNEPIPQQNNFPSSRGPNRHRQNMSSPMTVKHSGRTLEIPKAPKQPPPNPPVSPPGSSRHAAPPQPTGQLVPPNFVMGWKSAGKEDKRQANVRIPNLSKSIDKSKSMDNLRGSPVNIPSMLQPGRRPSNLPTGIKISGPSAPREGVPIPIPNGTYNSGDNRSYDMPGLPKSYDPGRGVLSGGYQPRPIPVQGSTSNLDFSTSPQSLYPSSPNEKNPSDDPRNSPVARYGRALHSPGLDSPYENSRSPRATSPSRFGSRLHVDVSYGDHGDAYGGIDTRRTPPRSPHSPRASENVGLPQFAPQSKLPVPEATRKEEAKASSNDVSEFESTMKPEEAQWFRQTLDKFSETNFDATIMPQSLMNVASKRPEVSIETAKSSWESDPAPYSAASVVEEDSESDNEGTFMWKKRPQFDPPPQPQAESELENGTARPPLTVQISGPSRNNSAQAPSQAPAPIVVPQATRPAPREPPTAKKGPRISTFTERESSWAPRPPPEDVYERLEEFFPNHDLDKPVIEASSGGTSPTAVDFPIQQPLSDKARIRNKKSIRIVAEEHKKKIDRTSRVDAGSASNMLRKRSTKFWGSRVEEVTPGQAKVSIPATLPESPSSGPKPIFKWVRGELIGRGTYGRVYLALNATTGEMIAVKQVEIPRTASDKNDSRQVTMVQALKLESETLKDLDHPNIVSYLGFEETTNFLSIFLEYVPGGSVGSCLQKHGKFDEEVTKSFASQILSGLEYLHSKNILHRDLKADNILVETTGICKISDFGISKRTDDITGGGAHTAMQGTVFWMAPEVINTQPGGYNFKIDIWSVGCVVLEMWAGLRPWIGDEAVAVMFKLYQMKQPPPVPDGVTLSPLADDLRRKCFAINPDERPSAAELRRHPYLTLAPGWTFTGFK